MVGFVPAVGGGGGRGGEGGERRGVTNVVVVYSSAQAQLVHIYKINSGRSNILG